MWLGNIPQPHFSNETLASTSGSICVIWHLLIFPLLALLEPLAKAERLPKKFEDVRAVRQPVEQRCREMFLPHHGIPVAKFEVGGNDDRAAFIERRAELEEEVRPITTERNEAEFIQDQEIMLTDPSHEA